MADFRFTNEHQQADIGNIVGVLESPRLWIPTEHDYPKHSDWLQKAEAQLAAGTKRAMLAYAGREPIGTVIYQRHETSPKVVEVKNISISPTARGRYIGSFLLRNTEIEATSHDFPKTSEVMVDTKVTNNEMITFLIRHGYRIEKVEDLYEQGTGLDAVLVKTVDK
jgi:ribosomal protein S18 acetylase RimI-like enzyme